MELANIKTEIDSQLTDPTIVQSLLATTFKKLTAPVMKQAIMEGMLRGFTFKDFLEKNIYAIPYGQGYSLVTSIDHARKIGMHSGICGVLAPVYEVGADGKIISCTVTVQRRVGEYVGEYAATVFFDEYYKAGMTYNGQYKPSMWDSKPRTMLAKVAEMHALRKACPETLSQSYVEEEGDRDPVQAPVITEESCAEEIEKSTTIEELRNAWAKVPPEYKAALEARKDELKTKLTPQV